MIFNPRHISGGMFHQARIPAVSATYVHLPPSFFSHRTFKTIGRKHGSHGYPSFVRSVSIRRSNCYFARLASYRVSVFIAQIHSSQPLRESRSKGLGVVVTSTTPMPLERDPCSIQGSPCKNIFRWNSPLSEYQD